MTTTPTAECWKPVLKDDVYSWAHVFYSDAIKESHPFILVKDQEAYQEFILNHPTVLEFEQTSSSKSIDAYWDQICQWCVENLDEALYMTAYQLDESTNKRSDAWAFKTSSDSVLFKLNAWA